ncbi:uncharacterized protein LOC116108189 [Pistacia vera]|uniref:uncharacterized protein LOC116108189 n=1 Tax=Pistacia vera TaxID=55513 RepID=UPI0012638CA7|nr:uncharacterized protein LOC116108189 [Pistacia vera]
MKIQYVLEEQEVLEAFTTTMEEPEEGVTAQHRLDRAAYDIWKKKNSTARITLLSSMDNDLMKKYRDYELAKDMWSALATKFGEEQEVLEALTTTMEEPEEGATTQHRRDRAAYDMWKKKNSTACITLLSNMDNDLMKKYRDYELAKDMWSAFATKFGGTSITKLRSLTIKFDTYKKKPEHTMRVHLRHLSNMISKLRDAGHVLTDEQQVQAVIRSLPHNWEHEDTLYPQ